MAAGVRCAYTDAVAGFGIHIKHGSGFQLVTADGERCVVGAARAGDQRVGVGLVDVRIVRRKRPHGCANRLSFAYRGDGQRQINRCLVGRQGGNIRCRQPHHASQQIAGIKGTQSVHAGDIAKQHRINRGIQASGCRRAGRFREHKSGIESYAYTCDQASVFGVITLVTINIAHKRHDLHGVIGRCTERTCVDVQ